MTKLDIEPKEEKSNDLKTFLIKNYNLCYFEMKKIKIDIIIEIMNFLIHYYLYFIIKCKAIKFGEDFSFILIINKNKSFIITSINYIAEKMIFVMLITIIKSIIYLLFKEDNKNDKRAEYDYILTLFYWCGDIIKISAKYVVIYSAIDHFFN